MSYSSAGGGGRGGRALQWGCGVPAVSVVWCVEQPAYLMQGAPAVLVSSRQHAQPDTLC